MKRRVRFATTLTAGGMPALPEGFEAGLVDWGDGWRILSIAPDRATCVVEAVANEATLGGLAGYPAFRWLQHQWLEGQVYGEIYGNADTPINAALPAVRAQLVRLPHIAAAIAQGWKLDQEIFARVDLAGQRTMLIMPRPRPALMLAAAQALVGVTINGRTASAAHVTALVNLYQAHGYVAALEAVAAFYRVPWVGTGDVGAISAYLASHHEEWETDE